MTARATKPVAPLNAVQGSNDLLINDLLRLIVENVRAAERGEYRGGSEIRYHFRKGRLVGVHFNNRFIGTEDN